MDPLVIRLGAAEGALASGMNELERTVEEHGGYMVRSWTVGETGYVVVDVSPFEEQIDEIFDSVPLEFEAGAPVFTDEAWIQRSGGLDGVLPIDISYHIELPGFDDAHNMAVRPAADVCEFCSRIGHKAANCPNKPNA
jgi:hypothetical protein